MSADNWDAPLDAQPPPKRTAADVLADLAKARRDRDLTTCQLIWNLTAVEPRKEQQ